MSSVSIVAGIWMVAGLCLASPVASQDAAAVDLNGVTARLETEIHKILEETGIPAISVALVRDGDVVWTGAYGYANVGASVRATTETYFSTGSTFKFVTATAIMQLVEKGDLELDTPLNEFVGPDLTISGADDVTFRHLLSHHSGLRGPVATVPLWSREARRARVLPERSIATATSATASWPGSLRKSRTAATTSTLRKASCSH